MQVLTATVDEAELDGVVPDLPQIVFLLDRRDGLGWGSVAEPGGQGANLFSLTGVLGEMKDDDSSYTALMRTYARALDTGVKWHHGPICMDSKGDKTATGRSRRRARRHATATD